MLGKLIKHEWKETYRAGCLFLVALLGVTFLSWLAFQSPMWRSMTEENVYQSIMPGLLDIASVFTLLFYVIMLAVVSGGIMIYLAIHFYKTMYTDEGYLTHTLPVTKNQLMISKILIGGIWVLIVMIGVLLSLFALLNFLVGAATPEGYSLIEIWRMFCDEFGDMFVKLLRDELGINLGVALVFFIANILISPFASMTIIFGAISMGQLFTKHRVLMAIVSYFGLVIINGILGSVIESVITAAHINVDSAEMFGSYMNINLSASSILSIVMAVAMYLVSYFVTTKKLNME